jgi:hypothetical protein
LVNQSSVSFTRGLVLVPVLAVALAGSGCGGSSPAGTANANGSCTIATTVSAGGITISQKGCEEGEGLSAAQQAAFMQQCMPSSGLADAGAGFNQQVTYAAGACSRAGAIGGCRVTQAGQSTTTWFYQGVQTAAQVQQQCTASGGTFVSP